MPGTRSPISRTASRLAAAEADVLALGLLDLRRVLVDVLLARQLHQLVHDLVGHRPLDEPVARQPLVAREVQRLAEDDAGAWTQLGEQPSGRLDDLGVDHGARDDQRARFEREARDAGLAAVQAAVRRPGALGIDAEQRPLGQHSHAGRQGGASGVGVAAVDRHHADGLHEAAGQPTLQPGGGEVLRLGQERDLAPDHDRHEERVAERQVVAGDDRRTVGRNVLGTLDPRPPEHPEQRPEEHQLGEPVPHAVSRSVRSSPPRWATLPRRKP